MIVSRNIGKRNIDHLDHIQTVFKMTDSKCGVLLVILKKWFKKSLVPYFIFKFVAELNLFTD